MFQPFWAVEPVQPGKRTDLCKPCQEPPVTVLAATQSWIGWTGTGAGAKAMTSSDVGAAHDVHCLFQRKVDPRPLQSVHSS